MFIRHPYCKNTSIVNLKVVFSLSVEGNIIRFKSVDSASETWYFDNNVASTKALDNTLYKQKLLNS